MRQGNADRAQDKHNAQSGFQAGKQKMEAEHKEVAGYRERDR